MSHQVWYVISGKMKVSIRSNDTKNSIWKHIVHQHYQPLSKPRMRCVLSHLLGSFERPSRKNMVVTIYVRGNLMHGSILNTHFKFAIDLFIESCWYNISRNLHLSSESALICYLKWIYCPLNSSTWHVTCILLFLFFHWFIISYIVILTIKKISSLLNSYSFILLSYLLFSSDGTNFSRCEYQYMLCQFDRSCRWQTIFTLY